MKIQLTLFQIFCLIQLLLVGLTLLTATYDHILAIDQKSNSIIITTTTKTSNKHECVDVIAPGKTVSNSKGEFAYITSYYYIPKEKTLYILALGNKFFIGKLGQKNMAFNRSFNAGLLRHPIELFPVALKGNERVMCRKIHTSLKDASMHDKLFMTKCQFNEDSGDKYILMEPSKIKAKEQYTICMRFLATQMGRIVEHTTRSNKHILTPNSFYPSLTVCIAGISHFTTYAKEIISTQIRELGIEHLYLGINSEDPALLSQYHNELGELIRNSKVSIIPSSVASKDVTFTQGKLPILNECLMQAKLYGDMFLGVWDMDEMLIAYRNTRRHAAKLLLEMNSAFQTQFCYVRIPSTSLLSAEDNLNTGKLANDFAWEANQDCGNYSKSILVVPRVDFVGIHLPESCDLYPKTRRFSEAENFVFQAEGLLQIVHFIQMWEPKRYSSCVLKSEPGTPYSRFIQQLS
jgi:hypothetical protein